MGNPTVVLHLTTGIVDWGGAETSLLKLIPSLNPDKIRSIIVSLMPIEDGQVAHQVLGMGVPIYCVPVNRCVPHPKDLFHLLQTIRDIEPDIVHGWMVHGNFAASLINLLDSRIRILWNVRGSRDDVTTERGRTRLIMRVLACLSSRALAIVYNSRRSAVQHERIGYARDRTVVIPNGFECERFTPSTDGYISVRRELGIPDHGLIVGRVGRYHPVKDYRTLLMASERFLASNPRAHLVLVGKDVSVNNKELSNLIRGIQVRDRVHLMGERNDMPRITAAFDVAVSCSSAESFPSVVGEAMACGVPCVVTDVGDSAAIIGNTGVTVPRGDYMRLAQAIEGLLALTPETRSSLGQFARLRIQQCFSLSSMTSRYESLYRGIAKIVTVPKCAWL